MFRLALGFGLDLDQLDADLRTAADRINDFASTDVATAANKLSLTGAATGAAAGTDSPDKSNNDGAQAVEIGARMKSALESGMAPIGKLSALISAQLDSVSGTIITLARRIDSAIKFPKAIEAAKKVKEAIETSVKTASAKAETDLNRVDRALLRLAPAASTAVNAFMLFKTASHWIGNMGDVAEKSLAQVKKIGDVSLSKPAAGAAALGGAFKTVDAPVKQVTASVKGLGREIALALGAFALVSKTVEFFKGGISGAMNLGETVAKTKEVFGEFTGSVVAQADQMAKAFGLPKQAMLDAASSFGLIGQGAGQSQDAAAKMSTNLARLAADASSFYNVPLDQSLEKIRAGLTGESEPLRAFGVLLSEAAVKTEALRMGLVKKGKELDESSKVAARASLIEKGLATASGDLARTADSAANQFRKAGGGVENFAVSIGELLMPAVQSGVGAFNEFLATMIEVFETNRPLITGFADGVKAAFDSVGMVVRNAGTLWKITELRAVEFVANALAAFETLPANLAIIGEYVANNWSKLVFTGVDYVLTLFINLGENIRNLGSAIVEFFKNPTGGFKFEMKGLTEGFQATADALPEMVKPAWVSMQNEIDRLGEEMAAKEAKRAAAIAAPLKKAAKPEKDKKDDDYEKQKVAGVAEFGSKEAYKTIAHAMVRGATGESKEAAAKSTAKSARELVEEAKKQSKYMEQMARDNRAGLAVMGL